MSGSGDIISFDLRAGHGSVIDLAGMLPLSHVHALEQSGGRVLIDDMVVERATPDLREPIKLVLERFHSLETLDIATQSIRNVTISSSRAADVTRRRKRINIIPPLYIPYGSLDVRRYQRRIWAIRYPDLFTRSLPYGLMVRRAVKGTGHLLRRNRKPIAFGFAIFFACSVPLLFFVKTGIEQWYAQLSALSHATGSLAIQQHALSARGYFERAHIVFLPFSWIPMEQIELADTALRGGLALSRWLDTLARTLPTGTGTLSMLAKSQVITPSYRWSAEDIFVLSSLGIESPTTWMQDNEDALRTTEDLLRQAGQIYGSEKTTDATGDTFRSIGGAIGQLSSVIGWYFDNEDQVLGLLGDGDPKRYIVFNQNRDEIRANGGFPGSVITFTLYKGNILDSRKDDVYYYDWNLYPYKEIPPPGIALLTDNYGLRDVNYYPDFRTTLEKANAFIERSGDSTLTTGIAIHQWLIEDILQRIGPVTVSGVTIPFTHDNFSALMSTLVETQYGRETHAKDVLFAFIDAFGKKIVDTKSYLAVTDILTDAWKHGDILVASRDHRTDEFLAQYRKKLPWECDETLDTVVSWDTIARNQCARNWIYPIFTSVSGNKSDRYIERTYRSTVTKILGCKYENLITITNTHTFGKAETEEITSYLDEVWVVTPEERAKYMFIEWNAKNKAFVRLYTPLSSELAYTGTDIKSEINEHATVFSFMLETPPGGSASKTVRYTTNVPNCYTYEGDVDWYMQPGLRRVDVK